MKIQELLEGYSASDTGRYGKCVERALHKLTTVKQKDHGVTANGFGRGDFTLYTQEKGKRVAHRIEVKTGAGAVAYGTTEWDIDKLFPKADYIAYWMFPNDIDEVEQVTKIFTVEEFKEMLRGYKMKNGNSVSMLKASKKRNQVQIQEFSTSSRRIAFMEMHCANKPTMEQFIAELRS